MGREEARAKGWNTFREKGKAMETPHFADNRVWYKTIKQGEIECVKKLAQSAAL
jgi:hypothetical protein